MVSQARRVQRGHWNETNARIASSLPMCSTPSIAPRYGLVVNYIRFQKAGKTIRAAPGASDRKSGGRPNLFRWCLLVSLRIWGLVHP